MTNRRGVVSMAMLLLYFGISLLEWYLALRRTLAVTRGEKTILVIIVFIENLLGLWVLSNFITSQNWALAIAYSIGGACGSLLACPKPTSK